MTVAEDVAKSTTQRWVRLAQTLDRVEPGLLGVERHRLIDDLIAGRRRFRCVEAIDGPVGFEKGAEHTALPESYWRWGTLAWEWSTLTYAGRSFAQIEILLDEPPPPAAAAAVKTAGGARPWIMAEVERLKAVGQLEAVKRITDLAKLLETHMRKCAERDSSLRPVSRRYLSNHLRRWGLWPLTP
jgi:hypothetical protein